MRIGIDLSLTGLRGGGFSPAILFADDEEGVWFDPSDLSTLFQDTAGTTPVTAAGQSVARINDKSGNGHNATQATAANRPTYEVDGDGRGYLSFDGANDSLVTPTITPGTDKVQVFAGVRKLSDAATAMLVETSTAVGSNNGTFSLTAPNGAVANYSFLSKGTTPRGGNSPDEYAAPITNVLTGIGDISGDIARLRVNGSQVSEVTLDQGTGNFLAYPLYIGARGGTSLFFNGRLYQLITRFGPNLTTPEIENAETFVNTKTGAY